MLCIKALVLIILEPGESNEEVPVELGQARRGNLKGYDHLTSVRNAISVVSQNFGCYEGSTTRTVKGQEILDLAIGTGADQVITA